jgi:hypothetical protein
MDDPFEDIPLEDYPQYLAYLRDVCPKKGSLAYYAGKKVLELDTIPTLPDDLYLYLSVFDELDLDVYYKDDCVWWTKRDQPNCKHRGGDRPAFISNDDVKYWYKEGHIHRSGDLPAIFIRGSVEYVKQGIIHRDNGPAMIHQDGTQLFYRDGRRIKHN